MNNHIKLWSDKNNSTIIQTPRLSPLYTCDIPKNINDIFYPADYNWFVATGHAASPKTIEYFANKKK